MKKMIVANHKMNLTIEEMDRYLNTINNKISDIFKVVICPSNIFLYMVRSTNFDLGAQNAFYLEKGSYTGEVSPSQLKSLGVSYVIIGHSERRIHFKEDDLLINQKLKALLKQNLKPILCIGETLEEKQLKKTYTVLKNQLLTALKNIAEEEMNDITIAYEPVWAIGTGKTPSDQDIKDSVTYIKKTVEQKYNIKIKTLYGGSVNKTNIKDILRINNVDGLLIGSSSLDPEYFIKMIELIEND